MSKHNSESYSRFTQYDCYENNDLMPSDDITKIICTQDKNCKQ